MDSQSGLAHRASVTAANVHDRHLLPELLHGQERWAYGDCAYVAQHASIQTKAPRAQELTNKAVRKGSPAEALERLVDRANSRVRAWVEHVFGVVKMAMGSDKARYRRLAKNATRAFVATSLVNMPAARGQCLPISANSEWRRGRARKNIDNGASRSIFNGVDLTMLIL